MICYGLGIDDPKRIFGTTVGLKEEFGNNRVFDMPTSENAMTGVAIGAGLVGYRSVMVHQRLDFFLLAMDQLVNGAAKWHYMFGGKTFVSITIRLIVGRGWGQGPTHSQSLQAWFAHIPGLKVVMPSTAYDAKGLLLSSIFDNNPVIFIEHRWLHNQIGNVPKKEYRIPLKKAKIIKKGNDLTIVSISYMTVEALKAINFLNQFRISCELIDLRSISPIDYSTINLSVKKTGRLLVLDTGHSNVSVASEIVARISMNLFDFLKTAPKRIALPDVPTPASFGLTKNFYPGSKEIVECIIKVLNKNIPMQYRHPDGLWFGLTLRARVVYAHKIRVKEGEVITYDDLTKSRFKGKFCTRSGKHAYNLSLLAAVIEEKGEKAAEAWARGLKSNLARKPKGNDRAQVKAIKEGLCDVSLGNTYYMGKMATNKKNPEQKEWASAVQLLFPKLGGNGTHVNISGAAMTRYGKNKANAKKLLEFLSDDAAQKMYAEQNFEYPVKSGVARSPMVESWGSFFPSDVNLETIAKHRSTATKIMDRVNFDG